MIKGILLDYGGTIDTNGRHWAEVLWECYRKNEILVTKEAFREAYKFGEYSLATLPLVTPAHDFLQVLQLKIEKQFSYLQQKELLATGDYTQLVNKLAADANMVAIESIRYTSSTLAYLASKYPVVMVSNFYGNLETVLKTFGIRQYFQSIVESSLAGVRKPDPAIYSLGVEQLNLPAGECLVIGDSYSKDILPGKLAGCMTAWLRKEGWGDDPADIDKADFIIGDFSEITSLLKN